MQEGAKESPCLKELSSYFSPELVTLFKRAGKPVPYMMIILDQACQHRECPHHILNIELWPNGKETEYSRTHANCMCLIEDSAATIPVLMETLGQAWGSIQNREDRALKKIRKNMPKFYGEKEVTLSPGRRPHVHRAEKNRFTVQP